MDTGVSDSIVKKKLKLPDVNQFWLLSAMLSALVPLSIAAFSARSYPLKQKWFRMATTLLLYVVCFWVSNYLHLAKLGLPSNATGILVSIFPSLLWKYWLTQWIKNDPTVSLESVSNKVILAIVVIGFASFFLIFGEMFHSDQEKTKQSCDRGDVNACVTILSRSSNLTVQEKECSSGNSKMCGYLGELYNKRKDDSRALPLMQKACEQGEAYFCVEAGQGYLKNKNHAEAKRLESRGCELNDAISCYNAGCYACLMGDPVNALKFLQASNHLRPLPRKQVESDADLSCLRQSQDFRIFTETLKQ